MPGRSKTVFWYILKREYGLDAGQFFSPARIDLLNPTMGDMASKLFGNQCARSEKIAREPRLAGYFGNRINASD